MISVVKVNVITDDAGLPGWLKDEIEKVLQTAMREDPDGPAHANIQLEWKETVMPRSYMTTLVGRSAERIKIPDAPKAPPRKTRQAK